MPLPDKPRSRAPVDSTQHGTPSPDPDDSIDDSLELDSHVRGLNSSTALRGSFVALDKKGGTSTDASLAGRSSWLASQQPKRGYQDYGDFDSDDSLSDNDPAMKKSNQSLKSSHSGTTHHYGSASHSVHDYAASSVLSLSDDEDWDVQATREHERILERLEDQLYRDGGEHIPPPSLEVQNWTKVWPHLRVRGRQALTPQDTPWQAYPPPTGATVPPRSQRRQHLRPAPPLPMATGASALASLAVTGSKVRIPHATHSSVQSSSVTAAVAAASAGTSVVGGGIEEVIASHGVIEEVLAIDRTDELRGNTLSMTRTTTAKSYPDSPALMAPSSGGANHAPNHNPIQDPLRAGECCMTSHDNMDTQGKVYARRARRMERAGFPPLSPIPLRYHTIMHSLFDDIFEWILPSLRPLLVAVSQSGEGSQDVVSTEEEGVSMVSSGTTPLSRLSNQVPPPIPPGTSTSGNGSGSGGGSGSGNGSGSGTGLHIRQFPLRPRGDTLGPIPASLNDMVTSPYSTAPQTSDLHHTSSPSNMGNGGGGGNGGGSSSSSGRGRRGLQGSTSGHNIGLPTGTYITRSVSSGDIQTQSREGGLNSSGQPGGGGGGGNNNGSGSGSGTGSGGNGVELGRGDIKYRAIPNSRAPSMAGGFRPRNKAPPLPRLEHGSGSGGGSGGGSGSVHDGGPSTHHHHHDGWYDTQGHIASSSRPTTVNARTDALQDSTALDFPLRVQTALPMSRTTSTSSAQRVHKTGSNQGSLTTPAHDNTPHHQQQSIQAGGSSNTGGGHSNTSGTGVAVGNWTSNQRVSRTSSGRRTLPPPPPRRRKGNQLAGSGTVPLPHTQTKT